MKLQVKWNISFYKEDFLKYLLPAAYTTRHGGLVKTSVDVPCPDEVGDNNWTDYFGREFNSPSGIIVRACLENKGARVAPLSLAGPTTSGRKIETINSNSGLKNYKEIFDSNSFSQISTSVASSLTSCALDFKNIVFLNIIITELTCHGSPLTRGLLAAHRWLWSLCPPPAWEGWGHCRHGRSPWPRVSTNSAPGQSSHPSPLQFSCKYGSGLKDQAKFAF